MCEEKIKVADNNVQKYESTRVQFLKIQIGLIDAIATKETV